MTASPEKAGSTRYSRETAMQRLRPSGARTQPRHGHGFLVQCGGPSWVWIGPRAMARTCREEVVHPHLDNDQTTGSTSTQPRGN